MPFQFLSYRECIKCMTLHPDIQCIHCLAQDPRIEWRKGGASSTAKQVDVVNECTFSNNNTTQCSSLPVNPLCSRMNNKVCTEINRMLVHRSGKAIINIKD